MLHGFVSLLELWRDGSIEAVPWAAAQEEPDAVPPPINSHGVRGGNPIFKICYPQAGGVGKRLEKI